MSAPMTPGPWYYDRTGDIVSCDPVDGVPTDDVICTVAGEHPNADGCLIAAAPELYEALEAALPLLQAERDVLVDSHTSPPEHDLATLAQVVREDVEQMDRALGAMRAALAKARGEQP